MPTITRGRADERGNEEIVRPAIEDLRTVALQDVAVPHDRDALPERHRFRLIVRHVHGGDAEPLVQLGERRTHADAKLGIEVRQRLVQQERLRLANDRASHRNPLPLAAGQLRRPALEQVLEAEELCDVRDTACDLGLRGAARLQPVAHVLTHRHVRVQGVGLEDHGDVAAPGSEVGHVAVADPDLPARHVLEAGDHPQQGRLSAPRRTDEHEKLAVGDLQRDVVDRRHRAECLAHLVEPDRRHQAMV
jgi:hypothetical protein